MIVVVHEAVVERLAADLRAEFPDMRGFSPANIWRMRQSYELHSCPEFLAQVAREMTREESGVGEFLSQVVRKLEKAGGSLILEQIVQEGGGAILERPVPEFLARVARELASFLPWWHHVELMGKVKDVAARLYYLRATARPGGVQSPRARMGREARRESALHLRPPDAPQVGLLLYCGHAELQR